MNKKKSNYKTIKITNASGKFFRKTLINKLPQMFNIFMSNMSFCSNEFITRKELDEWCSEEKEESLYKPKSTLTECWHFYDRVDVIVKSSEKQKLDLIYAYERFVADIKVFFRNIYCII